MEKNIKSTTLGTCIRMERKKAGLTQLQLGKMVGLGEARISKIENGAPITPEVASFILSKMGSSLQLKVINQQNDKKTTSFIMSVIYHFSKNKDISLDNAFKYLKIFKGLEYLSQYMDIEQTLSYDDISHNLSVICAKNGGVL